VENLFMGASCRPAPRHRVPAEDLRADHRLHHA
jgi:hypothetical protein